ncbi:hypothetical protein BH23GEM4_BH23GEM4_02420 [soil metagenome]
MRRFAWLLALLLTAVAPLTAQRVEITGAEGTAAGDLAREIVARDDYLLVERDTVLPADFRVAGDLVVVQAEVRLEGTVEGSVAVVDGSLFIRPGSRIGGNVAVIGGEVYPSGLATYGDVLEARRPTPLQTERVPDTTRVAVLEPTPPPRFELPGAYGIRFPTYDRVDGLTVGVSGLFRIIREREAPTLRGWVTYRTGREDAGGGAELRVPLRGSAVASLIAERSTFTNERWIRGDLANTAGALFLGLDSRDYYESDRITFQLGDPRIPVAIGGEWAFAPRAGALLSRDRSLLPTTDWSLFDGDELERANLQVSDSTIVSMFAGSRVAWRGSTSLFRANGEVEWAPDGVGDVGFAQLRADGAYEAATFGSHRVLLDFRATTSLDGRRAPPQRWSFLGGSGTLFTYPLAAFRGDRLVFLDAQYSIPLERVEGPFLGMPEIRLRSTTGTAWATGNDIPRWGQNLGVGVRFFLVGLDVWVDPARAAFQPEFGVTVGLRR